MSSPTVVCKLKVWKYGFKREELILLYLKSSIEDEKQNTVKLSDYFFFSLDWE